MGRGPVLAVIFFITITGFSQNLEGRLDSLLQGHIDKGEIHGCIAYVFQKDKNIINKAYGNMDIENKRRMESHAIFRIASLTKVLTAATALKLYEDGKFLLDEPVKKYIPDFSELQVISPSCKNVDSVYTVPLERDMTIRDLFRHTAGFGYGGNDVVGQLYEKEIKFTDSLTLKQFVHDIARVPLKFQPGSKWEYSFATDILGYLIEVISGKPLDICMNDILFNPIGMNDTGFYIGIEKLNRLCNHYEYKENKLNLIEGADNCRFTKKPVFLSGGGGCVSSVEDYSKFCQMLLNYGEYDGKRILQRQTVELLISNQIGDIIDRSFAVNGYGFGIGVNPDKYSGGTKSCFWAGAPYNNTFLIDYNKKVIAILLIQNAPWEHLGLMNKFKMIVSEEIK